MISWNRAWLIGFLLLVSIGLSRAGSRPALAHAILVGSDPAPNSIVNRPPQEIWLLFSEPVEPAFSDIAVFSQSGQRLETGDLRVANADQTALVVTLAPPPTGTYLVSWRVLSSVDGHTTSGTFPFGVGVATLSGQVGSTVSAAQPPTLLSSGGRWLTLTGLILFLGVFAFRLFVWYPLGPELRLGLLTGPFDLQFNRRSLVLGSIGLGLLGLGLFFTFLNQSGQYDLFESDKARLWLGTRFGSMWFVRVGLTLLASLYLLYLFRLAPGQSVTAQLNGVGLALALGLAVTVALVSHSAALSGDEALLALLADGTHLLAAGVWLGGLGQLGLALWLARSLPAEARTGLSWGLILNFSAMAATAVGLLLLSGGYLAWQHLGSWTLLFGTAYGLTLLLKLALAVPVFGIAALNLIWLKPRLQPGLASRQTAYWQNHFTSLTLAETFFTLLVLVASSYLTDLQRGLDAPLLTGAAGKVQFETTADDLTVGLSLEPGQVGQNLFEVLLRNEAGQTVSQTRDVDLRFTYLGQSIGPATATANPLGQGRYQVEGGYISLVGAWQIEVAVRRPDRFDVFAPFRMEAGLNGAIRSAGQTTWLEEATRFLNQSGGSITGLSLIGLALLWVFLAQRAANRDWQLLPLLLPGFMALWVGGWQLYTFYEEFTPAKFTTNPILPDSSSIARGQQLYEANCVPCHGPEGLGDGELAGNFNPPPANFTAGHTDSHPDGDVYYWISQGIESSAMPPFGQQLSEADIWHLVNYIRRLSRQLP
jgi:copper transport protein